MDDTQNQTLRDPIDCIEQDEQQQLRIVGGGAKIQQINQIQEEEKGGAIERRLRSSAFVDDINLQNTPRQAATSQDSGASDDPGDLNQSRDYHNIIAIGRTNSAFSSNVSPNFGEKPINSQSLQAEGKSSSQVVPHVMMQIQPIKDVKTASLNSFKSGSRHGTSGKGNTPTQLNQSVHDSKTQNDRVQTSKEFLSDNKQDTAEKRKSDNSKSNNTSKKKSKNERSLDEVLAENDQQMKKSYTLSQASRTHSDINFNDLSGNNLKMNTSIDKSKVEQRQEGGLILASDAVQPPLQGKCDFTNNLKQADSCLTGNEAITGQRDSQDTQKQIDFYNQCSGPAPYDGGEEDMQAACVRKTGYQRRQVQRPGTMIGMAGRPNVMNVSQLSQQMSNAPGMMPMQNPLMDMSQLSYLAAADPHSRLGFVPNLYPPATPLNYSQILLNQSYLQNQMNLSRTNADLINQSSLSDMKQNMEMKQGSKSADRAGQRDGLNMAGGNNQDTQVDTSADISELSQVGFLLQLKGQITNLQKRLKEETILKVKLLRQNLLLKKQLKYKEMVITNLMTQTQNFPNLRQANVCYLSQKETFEKSLHEIDKMQEKFKEVQKVPQLSLSKLTESKAGKEKMHENRFESQVARGSQDRTISPDEIPDKRISNIFDKSNVMEQMEYQNQTNMDQTVISESVGGQMNSLYYLEHNNSQIHNFNKPLNQKYNDGLNQNFDRSGYILNNSYMPGASQILGQTNLNITKHTGLRGPAEVMDQSYQRRYQDPPSQSRIIIFDDFDFDESGADTSNYRDDEVSQILFDKFNKSLDTSQITYMTRGNRRPDGRRADRSIFLVDRNGTHQIQGNVDVSNILDELKNDKSVMVADADMSKIFGVNDKSYIQYKNMNVNDISQAQINQFLENNNGTSEGEVRVAEVSSQHTKQSLAPKDISINIQDLTDIQDSAQKSVNLTNLQDVDNIHNATGLMDQSNLLDESQQPPQDEESVTRMQQILQDRSQIYQRLDRNQSMHVILEESQTENETTMDQGRSSVHSGNQKTLNQSVLNQSLNTSAMNQKIKAALNMTTTSHNPLNDSSLSPKSSKVNQLIRFFDKGDEFDKSQITINQRDVSQSYIQDFTIEGEISNEHVHSRSMSMIQSDQQSGAQTQREQQTNNYMDKRKISYVQPAIGARQQRSATIAQKRNKPPPHPVCHKKPSKQLVKKLVAKKRAEKEQINKLQPTPQKFNDYRERSRTLVGREDSSLTLVKSSRKDSSNSCVRERMNSISMKQNRQNINDLKVDHLRWKNKYDDLFQDKKKWLTERKEMKQQLTDLQQKNYLLELEVKKMIEIIEDYQQQQIINDQSILLNQPPMMRDQQEIQNLKKMQKLMQNQDISQINPFSQHNMTQLTHFGLEGMEGIGGVPGLGLTGLDFSQFNMDPQNMSLNPKTENMNADETMIERKGSGQGPHDISTLTDDQRRPTARFEINKSTISNMKQELAQNIKELEQQNMMVQNQLMNQTSFLLMAENAFDNSINLTRDFLGTTDQNNISAIPGGQNHQASFAENNYKQVGNINPPNSSNISDSIVMPSQYLDVAIGQTTLNNNETNQPLSGALKKGKQMLDETNFQFDIGDADDSRGQQPVMTGHRTTLDDVKNSHSKINRAAVGQLDRISEAAGEMSTVKKDGTMLKKSQTHLSGQRTKSSLTTHGGNQLRTHQQFKPRNSFNQNQDLPISMLLQQQKQMESQRRTADFNDLASLQQAKNEPAADQSDAHSRGGESQGKGFSKLFSFFKDKIRGSAQDGDQIHNRLRGSSQDDGGYNLRSSNRRLREGAYRHSEKSPDISREVSIINPPEFADESPETKNYLKNDDTPLRKEVMGGGAMLNFNQLIKNQNSQEKNKVPAFHDKRISLDLNNLQNISHIGGGSQVSQQTGTFHRKKESYQTADWGIAGHQDMLRGSIHQATAGVSIPHNQFFGLNRPDDLQSIKIEETDDTLNKIMNVDLTSPQSQQTPEVNALRKSATAIGDYNKEVQEDGPGFGSKQSGPAIMSNTMMQGAMKGSQSLRIREDSNKQGMGGNVESKSTTSNPESKSGSGLNPLQITNETSGKAISYNRITFNPDEQSNFRNQLTDQNYQLFNLNQSNPNSIDQNSHQSQMFGGVQMDQKSNYSGLNFNMLAGGAEGGAMGTGPSPVSGLSGNDASRKAFSGIDFSDKNKERTTSGEISLEFAHANRENHNDQKDQSSFISAIQRDKDASYTIVNNTNISLQNSYMQNASFLAPGNVSLLSQAQQKFTSGSKEGASGKNKTPMFGDIKPKNTGQSKIVMPQFQLDDSMNYRLTLGEGGETQVQPGRPQSMPQENLLQNLSKDEIMDLQEIQMQQQYLHEQQFKQQILQHQLMQSQALIQQQHLSTQMGSFNAGGSSQGGGAPGFSTMGSLSQMDSMLYGGDSHSYLMQQQLMHHQLQRQQLLNRQMGMGSQMAPGGYRNTFGYNSGVGDKDFFRNQFLLMAGKRKPQQMQAPQIQQQFQQQQMYQQNAGTQFQHRNTLGVMPSGQNQSAKMFFGNLIQKSNRPQQE